jgi:hypothetical protein
MSDIIMRMLVAIGTRFMTQAFLSKMIVYLLRTAADWSKKTLAEEIVDAIADALEVKEPGRKTLPPAP